MVFGDATPRQCQRDFSKLVGSRRGWGLFVVQRNLSVRCSIVAQPTSKSSEVDNTLMKCLVFGSVSAPGLESHDRSEDPMSKAHNTEGIYVQCMYVYFFC